MIGDLKPYPAMKDSGVEWLGEVPEHWEVSALRRKLKRFDGIKIGPFGSQLKLDQMSPAGKKVYGQANVIRGDFSYGTKFIDDVKFAELRACEIKPGDLVLTMMGTSGRCAVVPADAAPGIMDSHLLRVRLAESAAPLFVALLIDEGPYVKEQVKIAGKGSIMHGLNSAIVKDLTLALPPLPEQAAIVRYLDHVDRRVRRLTRAKRKLIALLTEQKQAIIHRAVTRGLDPDVPLKDSGVEWLGEVPEHWEVLKLKRLGEVRIGLTYSPSEITDESGTLVLRASNVRCGNVVAADDVYVDKAVPKMLLVDEGDILVCVRSGSRSLVGKSARIPREYQGVTFGAFMSLLRSPLNPFLIWVLHSNMFSQVMAQFETSTINQLTQTDLRNLDIPVPTAQEQAAIVEYLDRSTADIDTTITRAEREIELLNEYRTRLIADVVTGKFDVRDAAAALPEIDPLAAEEDVEEDDQHSEENEVLLDPSDEEALA